MSRSYNVFADIEGKLGTLRVECTRCTRKGRYTVAKLIARYGRRGNMSKWMSDLKGDCPNRDTPQLHARCDLHGGAWCGFQRRVGRVADRAGGLRLVVSRPLGPRVIRGRPKQLGELQMSIPLASLGVGNVDIPQTFTH